MGKPVHVYLLQGKYGAIFSAGLHQYAAELNRIEGVTADVTDYGFWWPLTAGRNHHSAAVSAQARISRIVLIGHSFGVTGATMIARDLAREGQSLELVFALDCSRWSPPVPLGANVARAVSLFDDAHVIGGIPMTRSKAFQGSWTAQDTSGIVHSRFDNDPGFRARAIHEVKSLLQPVLQARA
jgi:hypothetical protein